MRGANRIILLAALLQAVGCSLLLDEHELPSCTSHEDCSVLNEADDVAQDACDQWQCDGKRDQDGEALAPGRCVLRQRDDDSDEHVSAEACGGDDDLNDYDRTVHRGADELCDGKDNDGDAKIDEPNGAGEGVLRPLVVSRTTVVGDVRSMAITQRSTGAAAVWVTQDGDQEAAYFATLTEGESPSEFAFRRPLENAQKVVDADTEEPETSHCYVWGAGGFERPQACPIRAAAVAFMDDTMLSVGVAEVGRPQGQLRIGYARGIDPPGAIVRGPAARANSYLGIDIDETGRLTGASRGEPLGAAQPAVAALAGGAVRQALAAWIGDTSERAACGGGEANVEAVVAYFDARSDAPWVSTTTQVGGVTATGAPLVVPRVLGRTLAGEPPAIAAWADRGYFVAYGDTDGGVTLHFVPRPPDPVQYFPNSSSIPDEEPREMPPLPLRDTWQIAALEGGPVHGVALAVGREQDDSLELGLAWRERCGQGDSRIAFRRLVFSTEASLLDLQRETDGDRFMVDDGGGAYGAPAAAYTSRGLRMGEEPGGWFIAWADDDGERLRARRVSEHDGRLLDESEVISFGSADAAPQSRPFLYTDEDGAVRFAAYSKPDQAIESGRVSCVERE